jgi:hypothetical protein
LIVLSGGRGFFFVQIAGIQSVAGWKRDLEKRLKHRTKAIFVNLTLFDSDVRMEELQET